MTTEKAITFAENAQLLTDEPVVQEFYRLAEAALCAQQERENPKPLTLDELREMNAPVWCLCKPIEGGNGYWCLCQNGRITTPAGTQYFAGEIPHWVFLRHKPKEESK